MEVRFSFTIEVEGAGLVDLPVTLTGVDMPIEIDGMASTQVDFQIENPTDKTVEITSVSVERSGPASGKISVMLLLDAFSIQPHSLIANSLTIQPEQALDPGEGASVALTGTGMGV